MKRRAQRWGAIVIAVSGLAVAPRPAVAQSGDKAGAELLFEQARALADKGQYAEACPKFAESLRLDAGIGTMLWLADCYENNRQTASAWAEFKEAAGAAEITHDPRAKVARERSASLEPRLTRIMVRVSPEAAALPGFEAKRDGTVLGKVMWGMEVPVDPGEHRVEASANGRASWSRAVKVTDPGSTVAIDIPMLGPAVPIAPPPAAPAGEPTNQGSRRGSGQRAAGIVIAGVGVVGVGLGAVFGLMAKSTYDASNGDCTGNVCGTTGQDDRSSARGKALVSTVAFSAGAAAIVGGVLVYLIAPHGSPVTVAAVPGADRGGLALVRSW